MFKLPCIRSHTCPYSPDGMYLLERGWELQPRSSGQAGEEMLSSPGLRLLTRTTQQTAARTEIVQPIAYDGSYTFFEFLEL